MNRWVGLALVVITLGALALRLPEMDARPMHNDEAVNATKLQGLWEKGTYRYDPDEYHGPVLHYAALPVVWLSGAKDFAHLTEGTLRLVTVLFGAAMVLLLWLLSDGLGRAATIFTGVFTAVSPAMVFYSRYFIHEMPLVFFTMLLLAAGWRYTRSRRLGWALLAGAAAGLMYATKETFVIPLAALAGAAVLTAVWTRWHDQAAAGEQGNCWCRALLKCCDWKHLLAAAVMAGFVAVLFFSSFFTNASGPLDALRTYLPWLHRAGGASPHIHPWYFYLERLTWYHLARGPVWSEALIVLLAAIGFVVGLRGHGLMGAQVPCVRFLGFYTVLLTAAYSLISYKTPWCLLGFLHGMILLAGVGAATLLRWRTRPWLQAAVSGMLVVAMGQLLWLAWQTSFILPADRRNPYAYAQTSPDLLELVEKVQAIAKVHPQGDQMLIKVMMPGGDYWPLPWYLRQFPHVGWWGEVPPDPFAPVMIVGANFEAGLEEKSDKAHTMTGLFSLRSRTFLELYVESALWKQYVESRQKKN